MSKDEEGIICTVFELKIERVRLFLPDLYVDYCDLSKLYSTKAAKIC